LVYCEKTERTVLSDWLGYFTVTPVDVNILKKGVLITRNWNMLFQ